ncbi:pre-rRNA-processing protein TSR2 homolog isoform X1 [Octopus sinensis]|uniref:Pre-rRNA-processing protein TSR2 homolog n=1 Tax=Octopus sinensis TaxID=2607531 RepID=A0A6P7SR00_9MOLL|nr:pre-rRNA-processing protein TSR2 homolog isoform X1 [Octopus sinensis]
MSESVTTELFQTAVDKLLNSWTVLQLAVMHGFGGCQSKEKAAWLSYAIDTWFKENNHLDPYEVEDFLTDVMNKEFDTIADDGSVPLMAAEICTIYKLCQNNNVEEVNKRIERLPKANIQKSVRADSDEEEIGTESDCLPNGNNSMDSTAKDTDVTMDEINTTAPSEDQVMDAEEDGWHVVRKNRQKKT